MSSSNEFAVQTADADRSFVNRVTAATSLRRIVLLLIVLGNVAGSLYWINQNIVLLGNDASGYASDTLAYTRFFTPITPVSLFEAFTWPAYRTPGLFVAAQPFYWLFGVSTDSAQLVNVVALAGLVWITYGLGRYAAGPAVGLFSALLVGLLPMVFAMARLYYTELPLTALVALNLLALAECDGYRRRGWTVGWGVSLGLGLLVKWALPIYILLPTLWLFWRSGLLESWWTQLAGLADPLAYVTHRQRGEPGGHGSMVSAQPCRYGAGFRWATCFLWAGFCLGWCGSTHCSCRPRRLATCGWGFPQHC